MLRIRFLNVGQGDSIILEWQDLTELSWKVGIIDCNLYLNENPTLNYLVQNNYKHIEFVLLSHPHSDHFSGMKQLLLHCERNNISINYFFHTSEQVPDYLKAASKSITEQNELIELYQTIFRLHKSNSIEKQVLNNFSRPIELTENIQIEILSPSEKEKDTFISNKKNYYFETENGNHPKMNLLSTILKIRFKDTQNYILLTADADKDSFKRIGINYSKGKNENLNGTLLLGQIPHHGASANHYKGFWQNINRKSGCFAVFSVGKNHYGHPSQQVRNDLINLNYQPRYTMNLFAQSIQQDEISSTLNVFSKPEMEGSDRIFYFENSSNIVEISS